MDDTYYLANLRLGGWVSKTGQVTSDHAQAREFPRGEALMMAIRHKAANSILIPVRKEDMEAIA